MESSEEDNLDAPKRTKPSNSHRRKDHDAISSITSDSFTDVRSYDDRTDFDTREEPVRSHKKQKVLQTEGDDLDLFDDDGDNVGALAYQKFKAKKPEARKKALASTRRAKAIDAEHNPDPGRTNHGSTGVGVRAAKRKTKQSRQFDDVSSEEALMEWTTPDYVQDRRARFSERVENMKQAGLLLPPSYNEVCFSDDERLRHLKEKPNFPNAKSTGPYEDIELPYSLGVIPASIAQYLREYQVKGVSFLHEIFVYQKGGILGDDMGLGKTVQVITFLTAAFGKTGDERDKKRMRKMRRKGGWYPRALIICPGSLMANWQDELKRWGWWYADVYHGSVQQKSEVLNAARSGMLEIMITTYTTYRINKSAINTIAWDCVIADECHIIKERKSEITKSMNEINSLCRIGLTGTAIQNNYEELWTLLNWTSPGRFGPLSTWKVSISEPLKLGQSHNATVYELARARKTAKKLVENLLPQFFLRRMKTLIKDQLPKKSDRVVFCPLTSSQAIAYQNILESDVVQKIKTSGEPCSCGSGKKAGWCCNTHQENGDAWQAGVFPAIAYLQRLSNHLALLIPQSLDPKDKQAKDLDMLETAIPDQWKDLYATRDSIMNYSNPEFCGKWRVLKKLLKFWHDEGENKVLVFSHSVRLLKMLQALFISTSYNVKYLDGSMTYDDRYAAVHDFNTDPTQFVFLISTRAGGVGLNITSANKVVVVDPNWNPSYDLQAQDRAYRIGQTRDVEVFRLVSQGTLEEIVYARQIYKQQQASIGYNASSERRYFQGIQDNKDQKGEIFGLKNLFAYQNENVVLRDIVNKTNIAESRADVHVANLDLEEQPENAAVIDIKDEDNPAGPLIKPDPDREDAAMSQLAAEIIQASNKTRRTQKAKPSNATTSFASNTSSTSNKRHDPIQAILSSVGVSYTHENSEVIGSSRVEADLSRRAEAANTTISQQQSKVFLGSSQTHSENHSDSDDGAANFKYLYRPSRDVMRRQFCTMARWAGYAADVVEFALVVESWTQEQRRDCLEKFYRWRRGVVSAMDRDGVVKDDVSSGDEEKDVKVEIKSDPGYVKDSHDLRSDEIVEVIDDSDEDDEL